MDAGERASKHGRPPYAVYVVAATALFLKLAISWGSYGTGDVTAWQGFLGIIEGQGGSTLYAEYPLFIHPPSMVHLLQGIGWLQRTTGMPFPFCLRLPGILADAGSMVLLLLILAPDLGRRSVRLALCLTAGAPVSCMVSGFHGNTDPLMIFFLLLSLWWADRPGRLCLSGAALGVSIGVKVVPVIFLPAFFFHLRTTGRRLTFFSSLVAVVATTWMPYLANDPLAILQRLFGYRSFAGLWGLFRILYWLTQSSHSVPSSFERSWTWLLLAGLLGISVWMSRLRCRPSLFRQVGLLTCTFLSLTPGFAVQYLAWVVPWTAAVGLLLAAAFHVTSGVYLLLVYGRSSWVGVVWLAWVVVVAQLLCWVSVVAMACLQAKALARER